MLTTYNHQINNRTLTSFLPNLQAKVLLKDKNYLFDLSYLGVIDVKGDKARDFLQGQLSSDIRKVSSSRASRGALCNIKGRILALMDIIDWDGIKLLLPQDILAPTETSLSKVALLSRVLLEKNTDVSVFGFYLQNPALHLAPLPELNNDMFAQTSTTDCCAYHLGKGFYIIVANNNLASTIRTIYVDKEAYLGSLDWQYLRLLENEVSIYPESRGLFLPHRLGLHNQEYISFNKGCYKGQEIIARMHYKSTIKHSMHCIELTSAKPIYSGQKILDATNHREVGEIIDYSLVDTNRYLILASLLNTFTEQFLTINDAMPSRFFAPHTLKNFILVDKIML